MNTHKLYIKPEEVDTFTVLYQILNHARERYANRVAYRQIESKTEEKKVTFAQVGQSIDALRAALTARDLRKKHIAVIGETSIEWIEAYIAIVSGVGVCVPLDRELPPQTLAMQLDFADVDAVFCSQKALKKLKTALPLCQKPIDTLIVMRCDEPEQIEECANTVSFSTLEKEGKELILQRSKAALPSEIDPDSTCVIVYTSGTTGANKGVMLSNRNIMGTLRGCARLLHYPATSISVLPVNHSYELHAHLMSCLYCGTTVGINDDLKHLIKNLERFEPEMSCMVPLMLELIVKKLKKQIKDSGKEEKFEKAVRLSKALRKIGIDAREKLFSEIMKPLGGKLHMIICGGAALNQETADFLDGIGITVYNGYGITECSPVAAVNPSKYVKRHSVGHILPTVKARIIDPDENGNGEIQLTGDNVMQGYYKAQEDTEKVMTADGWFKTGDIGHLDRDNYLYISGRLKNLIILSNGKNIFPEEIEDMLLKAVPSVHECVVYSDAQGSGLYAICYADQDLCREKGLDTAEKIKAYLQPEINAFNASMPGYKKLTDFDITLKEFEKSTTHKIQRFKIAAVNK